MDFGYREEEESVFQTILKEWPILLIEIVVAVVLGFLVVTYGFEKTSMSGPSMEPVIQEDDVLVVNKMAYVLLKPKRNDVIVYAQEGKEHSYNNVKRVIGLPGETIQIIDGKIYINNEEYKEEYTLEKMTTAGIAEDLITIGEGEYFVLGDNRNQSEDSRYSSVGMIQKKEIVGKAWVRIKPNFAFVNWLKYEEKQEETE